MLRLCFGLCSFIPPALAAWLGWVLYARRGGSDASNSFALALAIAAAVSTAYALRMLWRLTAQTRTATLGWQQKLAIVVLPVVVAEVAMWTFALAWGLVQAALLTRRAWIVGHAGGAIVLRAALALCWSALVLYLLRRRTRPSVPERIRRLAARPWGGRTLQTMYRKALARGDRATVRAMAKAPGMPPELMRQLAADPDVEIRACVANNADTPPDVLDRLSREECLEVRRAVAYNPAVTIDQLRRFAEAPEEELARHAQDLLIGKLGE
jgi:hypothetical protein